MNVNEIKIKCRNCTKRDLVYMGVKDIYLDQPPMDYNTSDCLNPTTKPRKVVECHIFKCPICRSIKAYRPHDLSAYKDEDLFTNGVNVSVEEGFPLTPPTLNSLSTYSSMLSGIQSSVSNVLV